jgi:hypothetical protein
MYKNGALQGVCGNYPGYIMAHDTKAFTIGSSNGFGTMKGYLDDVRVYNRALTAAELALLTGWAAAGFPE